MSDRLGKNTELTQGIPAVTAKQASSQQLIRSLSRYLIFGAVIVGLLLAASVFLGSTDASAQAESDPERKHLKAEDLTSKKSLTLPPLPPAESLKSLKKADSAVKQEAESEEDRQPPAVQQETTDAAPPPLTPLNERLTAAHFEEPSLSLEELKFAAPMMGRVERSLNTSSSLAAMQEVTAQGLQSANAQQGSSGALAAKLNAITTKEGQTRLLRHPELTLNKGTIIDCILETRLDTSVPGMTSCVIPRDIYSSTGRVLLIERGTKVVGEYQGAVQNGLERIFLLWTQMRTPHSVVVSLDSPAADPLGGAGVGGYVNHHWFRRFGSALLFSMVADGFQYAISSAQSHNSNSNVTYNNSEQGVNEIIKAAMQQSGNIPPTLIKHAGERVSIFVARDVDFSDVYALTLKQGRVERTLRRDGHD